MPISALPTPPTRTDPSTFSARADAFMAALPGFQSEANALATAVSNSETAAATSAATSATQAALATTQATVAAANTGAVLWVSGSSYTLGQCVYSPVNRRIYRRIVAGAGTTDPSADATNWGLADVQAPVILVAATTQAAVAGPLYVLTNVAATTVTLPASPQSGDTVFIKPANGLLTNAIDPNGATIEGVAGVMTINLPFSFISLRYINTSWRLI